MVIALHRSGVPRLGTPPALRVGAALAVGVVLVAAVLGGLQRVGVAPAPALTAPAALAHAALMIGGWLGTVIALERAVALKTPAARAAPWLSAAGAFAMLCGAAAAGALLSWAASTAFVVAHVALLGTAGAGPRRAPPHLVVLALGALAWWIGNAAYALGGGARAGAAVLAAWFGFLVLTIAAERLELTRLTRRPPVAQPLFFAIVSGLAAAIVIGFAAPTAGGVGFGVALVLLAVWLARFDVVRHTWRERGLPRYIATALVAGYAWLAVGGVAWALTALGHGSARDAALHALGLGFVLSMVMAHAPVILPALGGVRLAFGPWFYAPLALLHASLVLRLFGPAAAGATLNALALLLFALTVVASAFAHHRQRSRDDRRRPDRS